MKRLVHWNFPIGQVAQLVERGPEKAGVGGSSPSLATIFKHLQSSPVPVWFHLVPKLKPGIPGFVSNPHFQNSLPDSFWCALLRTRKRNDGRTLLSSFQRTADNGESV